MDQNKYLVNTSFQKSSGNSNQSMSVGGGYTLKNTSFGNFFGFGGSIMNKSRRAPLTVMSAISKRAEDSEYTVTGVQNMDVFEISNFQDIIMKETFCRLNKEKMERVQKCKLITAVKTPYSKSGRIDLEAFNKIVKF